jgi:hypothetical protein
MGSRLWIHALCGKDDFILTLLQQLEQTLRALILMGDTVLIKGFIYF